MAGDSSPDYKALFLKEVELRKQAEGRNQPTTFSEFMRACHNLLSGSLNVESPSRSRGTHTSLRSSQTRLIVRYLAPRLG
jgi:hypothetical protein